MQRLPGRLRLINNKPKLAAMIEKPALKTVALILLTSFSFIQVNAQHSRTVAVSHFSGIRVASGIDLYLTQGNAESLVIKGESELVKNVVIEQTNGNLTVKYKDGVSWGRLFSNESIKVYVTFKELKAITASGGSDVFSQNTIKAGSLTIGASGGSDVEVSLTCSDLQVSASGGSDVKLKGSADNMILNASGGSDVDAFEFVVNYSKAHVSGGSDANINVTKGLEASANGGSDITYKGNAALKRIGGSKSGDINHIR